MNIRPWKTLRVATIVFYCGHIASGNLAIARSSRTSAMGSGAAPSVNQIQSSPASPYWQKETAWRYRQVAARLFFKLPRSVEKDSEIQCYYLLNDKIAAWRIQFSQGSPAFGGSRQEFARQLLRSSPLSIGEVGAAQILSVCAAATIAPNNASPSIFQFELNESDRKILASLYGFNRLEIKDETLSGKLNEGINFTITFSPPTEKTRAGSLKKLKKEKDSVTEFTAFFDSVSFSDFFQMLNKIRLYITYRKNKGEARNQLRLAQTTWRRLKASLEGSAKPPQFFEKQINSLEEKLKELKLLRQGGPRFLAASIDVPLEMVNHDLASLDIVKLVQSYLSKDSLAFQLLALGKTILPLDRVLFIGHALEYVLEKLTIETTDFYKLMQNLIPDFFSPTLLAAHKLPKLVAFDFDGTISNEQSNLKDEIFPVFIAIIHDLLAQGIAVALVSARENSFLTGLFPLKDWGKENILSRLYFYGSNGSQGWIWDKGKYIDDSAYNKAVGKFSAPEDLIPGVASGYDKRRFFQSSTDTKNATLIKFIVNQYPSQESLEDATARLVQHLKNQVLPNLKGKIKIEEFYGEVYVSLQNKGDAILRLMAHLGLSRDDTIWVAGDGHNDIPMFQVALANNGVVLFVRKNEKVSPDEAVILKALGQTKKDRIVQFTNGPKSFAEDMLRKLIYESQKEDNAELIKIRPAITTHCPSLIDTAA